MSNSAQENPEIDFEPTFTQSSSNFVPRREINAGYHQPKRRWKQSKGRNYERARSSEHHKSHMSQIRRETQDAKDILKSKNGFKIF